LRPADPSNPEYVRAVTGAMTCLHKARAGWLQVRTAEFPACDVEGAGNAAMALAGFALELDRMGDALRWLARAEQELGEEHESSVCSMLACGKRTLALVCNDMTARACGDNVEGQLGMGTSREIRTFSVVEMCNVTRKLAEQEYVRAVEAAIACLHKARAGWLHVRTAEFPAGDVEGAGKAAMALAGFALELDRFADALRWLARAEHELGEEHESSVEQNLDFVLVHLEQEYETSFLRENFKVWSAKAALYKNVH